MEFKSNITIASNVCNRTHEDIKFDKVFVRSCTDGASLRILDGYLHKGVPILSEKSTHWEQLNAELTVAQKNEMNASAGCPKRRGKQRTHGLVRNGNHIVWECRCEHEDCNQFSICMPNGPIIRIRQTAPVVEDQAEIKEYKWLGSIDRIFELPVVIEEEQDIEEPIPEEYAEAPDVEPNEFIPIYEQDAVIYADLDSRILVNAGPGTGKTHTVIERLAYIIETGEVELGQVLVLCYTNAARDVILQRLTEKGMSAEARQLVICTFDSLAWNYLSEKTDDDLFTLGYNGCIERFNRDFDAEDWTKFEYVIIDELQDLVNERAMMTLNIMYAVRCGYLLLGDNCQAIYDFDCDGKDKIDSVMFYEMIDDALPSDALKYELKGNRRQTEHLARITDDLRDALLTYETSQGINDYFKRVIDEVPCKVFSADDFINLPNNLTTAIITRKNGEAEWISKELRKKRIPHNLIRSANSRPSIQKWVAVMFWDYREQRISKDDFVERYCVRVKADEVAAESAFSSVVETLSTYHDFVNETGFIDVQKLSEVLRHWQNFSSELLNVSNESLTVSTIHKAKGREFDIVYLLGDFTPNTEDTQEARVWYVGATRPRTSLIALCPLKKYFSKPTPMNRRMLLWFKWGRSFCQNIVVGLPEDVDKTSFVVGNLHQSLSVQEHIAKQVQVDDIVEAVYDGSVYNINHDGAFIGTLNSKATNDFWAAIKTTGNRKNIPPYLSEIYVSNVVTISQNLSATNADAMFKESKFWLGVELSGFAKVDWYWEDIIK